MGNIVNSQEAEEKYVTAAIVNSRIFLGKILKLKLVYRSKGSFHSIV
jgi:hypothetical protein